jgi:hypothetical protein
VACETLSALFTFMLPILVQAFTRTRRKHLLAVYFALAFVYIRYYQPVETFPRWFHWGPGHKTVSRGAFYTMVVPITTPCAVCASSNGMTASSTPITTRSPTVVCCGWLIRSPSLGGCADGLVGPEPPLCLSKRARSVHSIHGIKVPMSV